MDGSRLAKMRVSCLKIEPKVSIFPVIEANVASITHSTTRILSSSLFLYFFSDTHVRGVEDFYCRWFSRSVRTTKTSQLAFLMTYSDTEPINKRSTAFSPVAPIIIKSI